jgi:hypothetical protein
MSGEIKIQKLKKLIRERRGEKRREETRREEKRRGSSLLLLATTSCKLFLLLYQDTSNQSPLDRISSILLESQVYIKRCIFVCMCWSQIYRE